MQKLNTPCVILCGGLSSRMKYPKANLKINNQSLAKYQKSRMQDVFEDVYLNAKEGFFKQNEFDKRFIINDDLSLLNANTQGICSEGVCKVGEAKNKKSLQRQFSKLYSPLLGITSILSYFVRKNYKGFVFILAIDMPNVSKKSILCLNEYQDKDFILAKTQNHLHTLCGFYHTNALLRSKEFLAKECYKLGLLCEQAREVCFEDEEEFVNLNYPEQYELWLKKIQKSS